MLTLSLQSLNIRTIQCKKKNITFREVDFLKNVVGQHIGPKSYFYPGHLSHVFQPIYSLQGGGLFGFESLIRSTKIHSPENLFSLAKKQRKLFELDMNSALNSITTFDLCNKGVGLQLSVNIFPSTLMDRSFYYSLMNVVEDVNLEPVDILFELNEAESVQNVSKLKEGIGILKRAGFKFALDDLGKGQSSLRIALELEPDFIKLDRYFCAGLEQSVKKQNFLHWISSYFKSEGVPLTLEGIEKEEQVEIARQAGVEYGQGFYLGRPAQL
ncbi:EAL domain-containing protein [Bacillus sp. EB01]|uniref:EAL domain-containing protein n=1 Tax=Bacillus sp. EB01 TaxID=1347086 RepID=UPI0009DD9375|nr:EAL domain-containing protein [Bacillus sp. EB01]